jgi:hypothetical protein
MRGWCGVALLVACRGEVTAESWSEDSSKALCRFQETCDAVDFYLVYDTIDACETLTTAYWDGLGSFLATCTFADDQANQCIDALYGRCDVFASDAKDLTLACSQSFDCDDGDFVFPLEPVPSG